LGRAGGNGHYDHGWHATSTLGVFGAAAVAARLWRMDTARLQMAWGLAASHSSGLTRNFGTMAKPYHAGHASRCGINAAWMADMGMTAHPEVFEAESGVLQVYAADGIPLSELTERLHDCWEILQPGLSVKRGPCCYATHRAIAGA